VLFCTFKDGMSKEGLTLKSSEPAFCRLECSWWSSYRRGMALAIVNIYLLIDATQSVSQGHSAKMSFYSGILYTKFFDCGVSQGHSAKMSLQYKNHVELP
jgi:hypothetical protein